MPTLRMRFPAGRYHATPWGHHVNEGQIEWPPSPWRLLRALIACGFNTQAWDEVPPVARQLLEQLAETLPSYRLPPATAAHSRHFMPVATLDKGRERTTLVFDTWAHVGAEALEIHWDCELPEPQARLLRQLVQSLGYLGRSESWVEAELVVDGPSSGDGFNAFAQRDGSRPGPQWEPISLLAAIAPHDYATWRRAATESILAKFPLPEGRKKPTAKLLRHRAKSLAPYPAELLDCLLQDTASWKAHGWSQPPGSRRVVYWRRDDALEVAMPRRAAPRKASCVTMMLLALASPSGNRMALPPCSLTLPQAELLHRAIVGRAAKGGCLDCPELTGRDARRRPLRDGHRHAHLLPVDLDDDGHLDHVVVYAPMGLSEAAQRAIRTLRWTGSRGGLGELRIALAGSGDLDTLRSLPAPFEQPIQRLLAPPQGARVWVSATPFVPPRFLKPRGVHTLLGQINAELASRTRPPVAGFEVLPWAEQRLDPRQYVRRRQRGGVPPPVDVGYALQLRFAQPLQGPLTLGYASHFGLGLFVAESTLQA